MCRHSFLVVIINYRIQIPVYQELWTSLCSSICRTVCVLFCWWMLPFMEHRQHPSSGSTTIISSVLHLVRQLLIINYTCCPLQLVDEVPLQIKSISLSGNNDCIFSLTQCRSRHKPAVMHDHAPLDALLSLLQAKLHYRGKQTQDIKWYNLIRDRETDAFIHSFRDL